MQQPLARAGRALRMATPHGDGRHGDGRHGDSRHGDSRGVAAMEFAMVAPIMVLLIWGVFDVSRALLAWEETAHAAQAVAQAAEKMSVTNTDYTSGANIGKPVTALTSQQMQDAMTTIYAEMPWLALGNGTGPFTGQFAVTLSGIAFDPLCPANATNSCAAQTPTVLWSTYLTQGGGQLMTPPPQNPNTLYRLCGTLTPVAQFPNNAAQLLDMIDPNKVAGGVNTINLIPQVVADVVYVFKPSFPLLAGHTYTFYASATFPAPLGGDDQAIVFDNKDSAANNNVENCPGGGSI
jgi:Flp pilus assembly protein TadG